MDPFFIPCIDVPKTSKLIDKEHAEGNYHSKGFVDAAQVAFRIEFRDLFLFFDADNTGTVSVEEIEIALKELCVFPRNAFELKEVLKSVDDAGDGEFGQQVFMVFMHYTRLLKEAGFVQSFPGKVVWKPGLSPDCNKRFDELVWKEKIWSVFENPAASRTGNVVASSVLFLITVSMVSLCLDTMPGMTDPNTVAAFVVVEWVCNVAFTIEYSLRLGTTPDLKSFMLSFLNLADLLSLVAFYLTLFTTFTQDSEILRIGRLFRVFRVFKFSRYLAWLKLMSRAASDARRPLFIALVFCFIATAVLSLLIFLAERDWIDLMGNISPFSNYFAGAYWCIITMTTVGYGDLVPGSTSGRVIGMMTMLTGVFLLAIPISIFSASFKRHYDNLQRFQKELIARERNDAFRKKIVVEENLLKTDAKPHVNERNMISEWQRMVDQDSSLTSKQRLEYGFNLIRRSHIKEISKRNSIRLKMLDFEMEHALAQHRKGLWAKLRKLERRKRATVERVVMQRYDRWFGFASLEVAQTLDQAITRIQALFRGHRCRLKLTYNVVHFKGNMRQTLFVRTERINRSPEGVRAEISKIVVEHRRNRAAAI